MRQDGLWDIEGFLTDGKSYEFNNEHRGTVKPGEFIHQMWMRWTVDDTLTIRAVEAVTDNSPFAICPAITPKFEQLEGMRVAKGFDSRFSATRRKQPKPRSHVISRCKRATKD